MTRNEIECHRTHCCVLHGCKYCSPRCPVIKRKVVQDSRCEDCHDDGLKTVPDPNDKDYDVLKMNDRQLRKALIAARTEIRQLRGEA
jgi:hypothetical protein